MPRLNIPYRQAQIIAEALPSAPRNIIAQHWIETAVNYSGNPAMIALHDIYQLLPGDTESKDINCAYCRAKILNSFQLMKPYLKHIAGIVPAPEDFAGPDYQAMYNESINL